jgi:hypothetical protein
MNNQLPVPLPLFIAFAVLGAGAAAFFLISRNAPLKRRLFPLWILVSSVLMLTIVRYALGTNLQMFYVVAALLVGSAWINLRRVRFCDACGRTVGSRRMIGPPTSCPSCGAALGAR